MSVIVHLRVVNNNLSVWLRPVSQYNSEHRIRGRSSKRMASISDYPALQAFSSGAQMFLLAKAPCWNFPKRGGNGLLFLLSPIFHCHNSGYNNTNTNKVSPTQNTPALQANFGSAHVQVLILRVLKLLNSLLQELCGGEDFFVTSANKFVE